MVGIDRRVSLVGRFSDRGAGEEYRSVVLENAYSVRMRVGNDGRRITVYLLEL